MRIYCSGCSVRLTSEFYNFEGQLVDPDVVKVIIYNHKIEKLEEFTLTGVNKTSTGKYFYDYQTINDSKQTMIIYEFYGEIDGLICRERKAFQTQFMIS